MNYIYILLIKNLREYIIYNTPMHDYYAKTRYRQLKLFNT